MKEGNLIPGYSSHFLFLREGIHSGGSAMTPGKIYKIEEWRPTYPGSKYFFYTFLDDNGVETEWSGQTGVTDCSFEENLKRILE